MSQVIEVFPPATIRLKQTLLETLQSNAKTPRHAPTIMVRVRVEDGRQVFFALNPKADELAKYETGSRRGPISARLIDLMESLGFAIEYAGEGR